MMPPVFAPIVEGHGEEQALLPLIHNIIGSSGGVVYPEIKPPYRGHWGALVNKPDKLERCADIALRRGGPMARLLVLLDADDRCPAVLGPELLQRLVSRFPKRRISVSIADREYESWFIAGSESIAAHVGLDTTISIPQNIEAIRDAKGWLASNLLHRSYSETDDQAAFSARVDVPLARSRSQSFDRFCREIERLLID